jgi:hypothetical protein
LDDGVEEAGRRAPPGGRHPRRARVVRVSGEEVHARRGQQRATISSGCASAGPSPSPRSRSRASPHSTRPTYSPSCSSARRPAS